MSIRSTPDMNVSIKSEIIDISPKRVDKIDLFSGHVDF